MPRNMSFALTTQQVIDQTKTVTRRKYTDAASRSKGWMALKPGDHVWGVEKSQGLQSGEKVNRLALIKIVEVRVEQLVDIEWSYDDDQGRSDELAREGFPDWAPVEFSDLFMEANGGDIYQKVIRIEFEYLSDIGEVFG